MRPEFVINKSKPRPHCASFAKYLSKVDLSIDFPDGSKTGKTIISFVIKSINSDGIETESQLSKGWV
jgi:hypothetical protein